MNAASGPLPERSVAGLARRYRQVRQDSESLATPLSAEDCLLQSMPDASPVKWHLGHTTWFFETMILARKPGYAPFDSRFAYLFNSYYEALGPRHPRPQRGMLSRPSLDEVLAWRRHVDAAMEPALADASLAARVLLGLHHEQQHQELILTDIKHAFFANPLLPAYRSRRFEKKTAQNCEWLSHPGGLVPIGDDGADFAFDNEQPRHDVLLHPFRIASRPATNSEYLAFIQDGGYRRPELWLSDGWARVKEEGWQSPLYWLKDDDGSLSLFTLEGLCPLDPNAPVEHVS
ncbi:MAG TPA: ergothioneine biosynthesis protein EgtB, partial [Rhizomicrobium sp.]|nr:ergothioneine biosynthesis protein EgtB [Rhizomicrobium sp.]